MNKEQVTEMAKAMAINVARNAGVVPEVCFPYIYLGLQDHFKAQAAIAPPVAAGSVDTMQRYDLTMSWGETVMEDCTSGDWVRYDDAIAWNAQECERAKNASSNCIKINEELIQEQRRAEKAEAELAKVKSDSECLKHQIFDNGYEIQGLKYELEEAKKPVFILPTSAPAGAFAKKK